MEIQFLFYQNIKLLFKVFKINLETILSFFKKFKSVRYSNQKKKKRKITNK